MEDANNNQEQGTPLCIDSDIINRARAADINIDAIIDQLKSLVHKHKGDATTNDVAKAYDGLFYATRPLLAKYNIRVEVAVMGEDDDSRLYIYAGGNDCEAIFLNEEHITGELMSTWNTVEAVPYFYGPKTILQNVVLAVSEIVKKNRETIRELDFATHFVKVLSDTNQENRN
jgi:hypothetical protein